MRGKVLKSLAVIAFIFSISIYNPEDSNVEVTETPKVAKILIQPEQKIVDKKARILIQPEKVATPKETKIIKEANQEISEEPKSKSIVSEDELNLIALVTMAEAEGECERGKRLVIDTILNRVDSEHFPDTITDAIYQPHQFTSMWNGRIKRCYVKDDIYQLVKEEIESRTDSNVIFFRTKRFSDYGVPMFQVGSHYFSSYD